MDISKIKKDKSDRMQLPLDIDLFEGFNIDRKDEEETIFEDTKISSKISSWPIKLKLISPFVSSLKKSHLLIAADCVAYAYGNFHNDFMKDKITLILCPKSEDVSSYINKIFEILNANSIESITLVRMEVPCCVDITTLVEEALDKCGKEINFKEVIVSIKGEII